jgi:hypothetical protein
VRSDSTPEVGYASQMRLHQNGRDLGEVSGLARRASVPGGGPDLLWFTVQRHAGVDVDAAELVGDPTERITIVDYQADDGLVVALSEHEGQLA